MNQKLKTLQIIHLAITVGTALAYYVIGNLGSLTSINIPSIDSEMLPYLAIPILAILLSSVLFKQFLGKIDTSLPVEEQMAGYQTASLIRWSILEGAAILFVVLQPSLWLFGALLIVYLLSLRPTDNRLEEELRKS